MKKIIMMTMLMLAATAAFAQVMNRGVLVCTPTYAYDVKDKVYHMVEKHHEFRIILRNGYLTDIHDKNLQKYSKTVNNNDVYYSQGKMFVLHFRNGEISYDYVTNNHLNKVFHGTCYKMKKIPLD